MPFYSFDTSAIINGRRDLLPPHIFVGVWTNIEAMIAGGTVRASDEVRAELGRRDDEIRTWAARQNGLFLPLTADVQRETRAILHAHPRLTGLGSGRNTADPFVIALARVNGGTVVTEERRGSLARPRIPDVCNALGVPCKTLVGFIDEQGWTFS